MATKGPATVSVSDSVKTARRAWRRVVSERGSVFLEYAMLSALVSTVALMAFRPGSPLNAGVGADYALREVMLKLPIF